MPNWYTNRGLLKQALSIPASTTADHAIMDAAIEGISRLFDEYLGYHVFPSSGTRDYSPPTDHHLYLDAPLLNVDAVRTTSDGSTYGTTLTTAQYHLKPYNATEESPSQPWWELELRSTASAVFSTYQRGTRVIGTWGLFNSLTNTSAQLATALTSNSTTLKITNATALKVGQTIRVVTGTSAEQLFITRTPGSATGAHTSTVDVVRAVNGTTAITAASGTTMQVYEYPIVQQAALWQAEQDYRAKDAPMGFAGEQPFGTQRAAGVGLHPFVRRMLDPFRAPVAL